MPTNRTLTNYNILNSFIFLIDSVLIFRDNCTKIQHNCIKLNDYRFCQKIHEIRLKQSENISWTMKKELLKFSLAIFGFFALIEVAYLINHHFRFGS